MAKLAKIRNISLEDTQRLQAIPGVYTDVFTRELDVITEDLRIEEGVPKLYLNLHVGSNQSFALSLEQLEVREDPSRVQYQLIPQPPTSMVLGEQATLVPAMPAAPVSVSLEDLQRQKEQEKIAQVQRTLEIQAAARQAAEEAKQAKEAEEQARRQEIIDSARSQIGIGSQAAPSASAPSSVSIPMAQTQQAGSFQYQQQEDGTIALDGLTPITGAMAFMMLASGYEVIDANGGALEFHKRSGQIRRYVGQTENTIENVDVQALMSPSYFVHESFLKSFIDSFAKIGQASF